MKDNEHKEAKVLTVEQVSAGGAAFRQTNEVYQIAIISVNPSRRWQLSLIHI